MANAENRFLVLQDDAEEEMSFDRNARKRILKAQEPLRAEPSKAKAKKPAAPADKKDTKAKAPEQAEPAKAPAKPEVAPASTSPAPERPPRRPLQIQRSSQRPAAETTGDATSAPPVRPKKREFDRQSGTGRGREQRKDGAGKGNWGNNKDPRDEVVAVDVAKEEAKKDLDATAPAVPKEGEAKEGEAPKEEPEAPKQSLDEYLKGKKKAVNFGRAPAGEVLEECPAADAPLCRELDAAPKKPVAEKKAADAKPAEKAGDKKKPATPVTVNVDIRFYDEQQQQQQYQRGGFRGGRGGRGGRGRGRPETQAEPAPAAAPAVEQPAAAAVVAPVAAKEDFPRLR